MTTFRPAARRRIPVGTCLLLAAMVLSLLVSAGPAYAATHIPTTTYTSNTTWTVAERELRTIGTRSAVGTAASHIVFTSYKADSAARSRTFHQASYEEV